MVVILTNGNRYMASFLTTGRNQWGGSDTRLGVSFYCTDAMLWFPLVEVKAIELGETEFRSMANAYKSPEQIHAEQNTAPTA